MPDNFCNAHIIHMKYGFFVHFECDLFPPTVANGFFLPARNGLIFKQVSCGKCISNQRANALKQQYIPVGRWLRPQHTVSLHTIYQSFCQRGTQNSNYPRAPVNNAYEQIYLSYILILNSCSAVLIKLLVDFVG